MSVEKIRIIDCSEKRLPPNHKLLLAGPAFLLTFTFFDQEKRIQSSPNQGTLERTIEEYFSIHHLFTLLLGPENILVAKTGIILGHQKISEIEWEEITLPEDLIMNLGLQETEIPFLSKFHHSWPRNAFNLIGGEIYAKEGALVEEIPGIRISPLGDNGSVLHRKNAVLVTQDIWRNHKNEIEELKEKGFSVGSLPLVNPSKQKYKNFPEEHLDCHACLIEGDDSKLYLVVADSYSRQGKGTRKKIRLAAETVEAEMVEIDDRNLPPFALNLIQFEDNSILMTDSEAKDLEYTLVGLVDRNRVYTTDIPIELIPRLTGGGIYCLTNTLSPQMIQSLE